MLIIIPILFKLTFLVEICILRGTLCHLYISYCYCVIRFQARNSNVTLVFSLKNSCWKTRVFRVPKTMTQEYKNNTFLFDFTRFNYTFSKMISKLVIILNQFTPSLRTILRLSAYNDFPCPMKEHNFKF